jgi:hypothetical protein
VIPSRTARRGHAGVVAVDQHAHQRVPAINAAPDFIKSPPIISGHIILSQVSQHPASWASGDGQSFMLENLAKPVIITGSQIPFCEVYNDARRNLIVSMIFASR